MSISPYIYLEDEIIWKKLNIYTIIQYYITKIYTIYNIYHIKIIETIIFCIIYRIQKTEVCVWHVYGTSYDAKDIIDHV